MLLASLEHAKSFLVVVPPPLLGFWFIQMKFLFTFSPLSLIFCLCLSCFASHSKIIWNCHCGIAFLSLALFSRSRRNGGNKKRLRGLPYFKSSSQMFASSTEQSFTMGECCWSTKNPFKLSYEGSQSRRNTKFPNCKAWILRACYSKLRNSTEILFKTLNHLRPERKACEIIAHTWNVEIASPHAGRAFAIASSARDKAGEEGKARNKKKTFLRRNSHLYSCEPRMEREEEKKSGPVCEENWHHLW